MEHSRHRILGAAAAFALLASTGMASPLSRTAEILDVSPERIAAFREAMREMSGLDEGRSTADGFFITSSYSVPEDYWVDADGEIIAPAGMAGRDVVLDEQLMFEGREDEIESVARRWLERRVKGSDAAHASRGNKLRPKVGWNDGPVLGVRKGPVSAQVGSDFWRIRISRPIRNHPGWTARAWVGETDGDTRIGFAFGRTLSAAALAR